MDFSVRHFIPGRIRLHVPTLCRRRSLAEAALAWLTAQKGIKHARMNYDCASLVIAYDVAFEAPLRAIVGRLSLMSLDDLRKIIAPSSPLPAGERVASEASRVRGSGSFITGTEGPSPRPSPLRGEGAVTPESSWRRMPLTLPTISLALAFSLNPIVRAINMPLMLWNA